MLPSLLKIDAIGRAIERHFALLAAALRADAIVDGWAEAFLTAPLANHTNRWHKASDIMTPARIPKLIPKINGSAAPHRKDGPVWHLEVGIEAVFAASSSPHLRKSA